MNHREWFLIRKEDGTLGAFERYSQFLEHKIEAHVVEYSAYEKLKLALESFFDPSLDHKDFLLIAKRALGRTEPTTTEREK